MDPVGPWYASYNRLAGAQGAAAAAAAAADFHHHQGANAPSSTTPQLLLQAAQVAHTSASPFNPGGFLSPSPVAYDAVFSPLFHHANPKPAHYATTNSTAAAAAAAATGAQHRKPPEHPELNALRDNYQHQQFFADGAAAQQWQAGSPFGVLPHESVVPSSPSPAAGYFPPQQQPQPQPQPQPQQQPQVQQQVDKSVRKATPPAPKQQQPQQFANFQTQFGSDHGSKSRTASDFVPPKLSPRAASTVVVRRKSGESGGDASPTRQFRYSNGPECAAIVPRRPSPPSRASPLGHAPSPAYPTYDSPAASASSPRSDSSQSYKSRVTPNSPPDASASGSSSSFARVAYPSVITRTLKADGYEPAQTRPSRVRDRSSDSNDSRARDGGGLDEEYDRVPPPAHAARQQNGPPFEFERWVSAPPPANAFAATAQASFSNERRQNLVASHRAAALPYFASFHFPSAEFRPSSIEVAPSDVAAASVSLSLPNVEARDGDEPKVVVPNIEEELGFLAERRTNSTAQTSQRSPAPREPAVAKVPDKKLTVPVTSAGSSFMASYLKFLQGERDKSPPPATRGGRKAAWSRSNKTYGEPAKAAVDQSRQTSNGTAPANASGVATNAPSALGDVGAHANVASVGIVGPSAAMTPPSAANKTVEAHEDPRYFQKDRKRKYDGADEAGYDPDDEAKRSNKPVLNVPSTPLNEKGKKGRGANKGSGVIASPASVPPKKGSRPGAVQPPPLPAMQAQSQYYYQQPTDEAPSDPLMVPQRRETSRRKVKERSSMDAGEFITYYDDADETQEFVDSDTDPAWNPVKGDEGQDVGVGTNRSKKLKRSRPVVAASRARNRGMSNILSVAAHGAGIDYNDYSSEDESSTKKLNQPPRTTALQQAAPPPVVNQNVLHRSTDDIMPYQIGEFIAMKTELVEAWPAIWRVDGKALLQKYEPFDQQGKVLYRNVSTYAGWNTESKKIYVQVPVRIRASNHLESIVELLRHEIVIDDNNFIEKRMQEMATYQDNFEVYIQTLISHALDPNFLTEIFQEQDDYFLTNVKTVDDITEERRRCVAGAGAAWSRGMEAALSVWPCVSTTELTPNNASFCMSCRTTRSSHRIQLYGHPYNPATLEPCQPDSRIPYEKELFLCGPCSTRAELYNRISHQKYLMYIECNKRVTEKRLQDPNKDTTIILNELLADEPWLSQLFRDVRQSWAEAESTEKKSRQGVITRQLM